MKQAVLRKQNIFTAILLALTMVVGGAMVAATPVDVMAQNSGGTNNTTGPGSTATTGPGSKDFDRSTNTTTRDTGALPDSLRIFKGTDSSLIATIITIVNLFLSLIGIALVLYLLYGGVRYAFAGANDEATGEAVAIIRNAIIGIVIIALVYVLANFLVTLIAE